MNRKRPPSIKSQFFSPENFQILKDLITDSIARNLRVKIKGKYDKDILEDMKDVFSNKPKKEKGEEEEIYIQKLNKNVLSISLGKISESVSKKISEDLIDKHKVNIRPESTTSNSKREVIDNFNKINSERALPVPDRKNLDFTENNPTIEEKNVNQEYEKMLSQRNNSISQGPQAPPQEYKFNNEYVSSVKEEKEKEKIFQEQLKQQSENQNQNIKMNIKEKNDDSLEAELYDNPDTNNLEETKLDDLEGFNENNMNISNDWKQQFSEENNNITTTSDALYVGAMKEKIEKINKNNEGELLSYEVEYQKMKEEMDKNKVNINKNNESNSVNNTNNNDVFEFDSLKNFNSELKIEPQPQPQPQPQPNRQNAIKSLQEKIIEQDKIKYETNSNLNIGIKLLNENISKYFIQNNNNLVKFLEGLNNLNNKQNENNMRLIKHIQNLYHNSNTNQSNNNNKNNLEYLGNIFTNKINEINGMIRALSNNNTNNILERLTNIENVMNKRLISEELHFNTENRVNYDDNLSNYEILVENNVFNTDIDSIKMINYFLLSYISIPKYLVKKYYSNLYLRIEVNLNDEKDKSFYSYINLLEYEREDESNFYYKSLKKNRIELDLEQIKSFKLYLLDNRNNELNLNPDKFYISNCLKYNLVPNKLKMKINDELNETDIIDNLENGDEYILYDFKFDSPGLNNSDKSNINTNNNTNNNSQNINKYYIVDKTDDKELLIDYNLDKQFFSSLGKIMILKYQISFGLDFYFEE